MQTDPSVFYPCYQEGSAPQHSESASANAPAPTDTMACSADARATVDPYRWSSADTLVISNGSSLTAFSDTAENSPRVPCPRPGWNGTLPASIAGYDYSIDVYPRPWLSAAGPELTNPKQVPSEASVPRGAWLYRAGDRHAVGAPAQPTYLLETDFLSCQVPPWSYMPTIPKADASYSPAGQVHSTSIDGVRSWVAQSVLGQVSSLSHHHRRRIRRSHGHAERVICDECQKQMRPQSLRRHIKEVHRRIKRRVKPGSGP